MPSYPVAYVSLASYAASWGGDSTPDTGIILSMPALSGTEKNLAIVFTAGGYDWDSVYTFHDSDGTQDTDFTKVFQNTPPGTHGDLQVYVRTGPGSTDYDNKTLLVRNDGGGFEGLATAQWWENVNQTPSCDTTMSTQAAGGFAPVSIYSAVIGMGISYGDDEGAGGWSAWDTDCTMIVNSVVEEGGGSGDLHFGNAVGWANPNDTSSSDYQLTTTATAQSSEYAFELFAYEIELAPIAGNLSFTGAIDKKLSLTRFLGGTLVLQGAQALLQLFKYIMDATVRMWLTPQSDPIEIDTAPKGFTDIGDDV